MGIGAALVTGGAALLQGKKQNEAAEDAAEAQERSAEKAIEEQRRAREQSREDLAPARKAGERATLQLQGIKPQIDTEIQTLEQRVQELDQDPHAAREKIDSLNRDTRVDEALESFGLDIEGGGFRKETLERRLENLKRLRERVPEQDELVKTEPLVEQRRRARRSTDQLRDFLTNRELQTQFLETDPVFEAAAEEAQQGLAKRQAAQGRLQSGETAELFQENLLEQGQQAIQGRTQQLAGSADASRKLFGDIANVQNQRFNQLFNLSSMGQNAAAGQATATEQTASQIGQNQLQAGAAQAAGTIGQANARTGAIGQVSQSLGDLFANQNQRTNQNRQRQQFFQPSPNKPVVSQGKTQGQVSGRNPKTGKQNALL